MSVTLFSGLQVHVCDCRAEIEIKGINAVEIIRANPEVTEFLTSGAVDNIEVHFEGSGVPAGPGHYLFDGTAVFERLPDYCLAQLCGTFTKQAVTGHDSHGNRTVPSDSIDCFFHYL